MANSRYRTSTFCELCLCSGVFVTVPMSSFVHAVREARKYSSSYRFAVHVSLIGDIIYRHYILSCSDCNKGFVGYHAYFD